MLNFSNTNRVFLVLFALVLGVYFFNKVSVYAVIFIPVSYSLILFYGCYYIGSNFFINVVCSAKTTEKVIAISFDDGPDPVNTLQLLETLNENAVEAAFFCIGHEIEENRFLLKKMSAEGHLIGNHSFSHSFWFDMLSSIKMEDDLQKMNKEAFGAINERPKLFRPPYGVTNPNLAKAIKSGNFIPVGWSVRTMDTVIKSEDKLLKKSLAGLAPGAVYLFHDTSKATVSILPEFLKQVKSAGYRVVRLDKMLNLQAYA